jgi:hypothetical protein
LSKSCDVVLISSMCLNVYSLAKNKEAWTTTLSCSEDGNVLLAAFCVNLKDEGWG